MKKIFISLGLLILSLHSYSQKSVKNWDKWNKLIGSWAGEGEGKPGQGVGAFSFKFDLDKAIIVRRSHSEYPATKDKPATLHDDLMIIYVGQPGVPDKAIYFDNEGHVINYAVVFPDDNEIIFTSEIIAGMPRFRLIYLFANSSNMGVSFEIAPPEKPEAYSMYISGNVHKKPE